MTSPTATLPCQICLLVLSKWPPVRLLATFDARDGDDVGSSSPPHLDLEANDVTPHACQGAVQGRR